jgi:hypothetical protein
MRTRTLVAALATVTMLAGGCGGGGSAQLRAHPRVTHRAPAGMSGMPNMSMADMHTGRRPSSSARMICGAEIRQAVQRTFALSAQPSATSTWSHRLFVCTYDLPHGSLRLAVNDATDPKVGRDYFNALRSQLAGSTTIRGAEAFGFPAFQTSDGNVVFLKDGKTLRVDAGAVSRHGLPTGFSREDAAYAVAAAVIACWTE